MFDSEFYENILSKLTSLVYITDAETDEIVYVNNKMKQAFGLEHPEGNICWKAFQNGMEGRCSFCKIDELKKSPGKVCVWREHNTCNGRIYHNTDSLQTFEGRLYHIQTSVDITDQLQLSMEASIDELTGVRNRQSGKRYLENMLKMMGDQDKFSIALYDINGLKWVNDTYGHLEGDKLLRFVAQTIQESLEEADFVFRLSGDEFIIVFVNKDLNEAESWMQKLISDLKKKKDDSGFDYDVSFSYGLASLAGSDKLTVSDILSIADAQMYIKKRDYHILMGKKRFKGEHFKLSKTVFNTISTIDKNFLFQAIAFSIEDYPFIGNLKTGEFMYSQKMVQDSKTVFNTISTIDKNFLFQAIAFSIEDYPFIGNLKTGEFMYSQKMVQDFGLPGQVIQNAAKNFLFQAIAFSIEDYPFIGNLKTGEFMYSQKMVQDFGLPGQVIQNAAAFWGERIHPEDEMMFLRSNQEITDGRIDYHTIFYRAKDIHDQWIHLLCKGRMIRDELGEADLFAGVIRNLDRKE